MSLDVLHNACQLLSLALSPEKCFSLHLSPSPLECMDTSFLIGGVVIPCLREFDEKMFLGKPIGFQLFTDFSDLQKFVDAGSNILSSVLAP